MGKLQDRTTNPSPLDSCMDNSEDNKARPLNFPSDNPTPMDTPMDTVPFSSDRSGFDSSPPGDSSSVSSPSRAPLSLAGNTHVLLPVVASHRGCSHAVHPSSWQGHTHVTLPVVASRLGCIMHPTPLIGRGILMCPCLWWLLTGLYPGNLPNPQHLPGCSLAASPHSPPAADGEVAAPQWHMAAALAAVAQVILPFSMAQGMGKRGWDHVPQAMTQGLSRPPRPPCAFPDTSE